MNDIQNAIRVRVADTTGNAMINLLDKVDYLLANTDYDLAEELMEHLEDIATLIKEHILEDPSKPRLPKKFYYQDDDDVFDYLQVYYDTIKEFTRPGDLILPKQGYRGNGIGIVGKDGELDYPIGVGNGEAILPAWMLELGIQNGYKLKELQNIYHTDTEIFVGILPKALQGKTLEVKDGVAVRLKTYGETDEIYEGDGWYYNDLNDPSDMRMDKLFL